MTAEGIISTAEDVGSPVLLEFSQDSAECVSLSFTEKVELLNLEVRSGNLSTMGDLIFSGEQITVTERGLEQQDGVAGQDVHLAEEGEGGSLLQVVFSDSHVLEAGQSYMLSGVAQDSQGNSLLFQVPFHGFNQNVAGVVFSEVRSGYSKPKVEYIELYVHTGGDMAGIVLSATNKDFEYVFPSVEVAAGEYLVLHMRTLEQESGHVDELDGNLNASTASDSCENARDLWVPVTEKIVGNSDVLVLRERTNGKMMDALLYAHPEISETIKKKTLPVAQLAVDSGAWQGSPELDGWAFSDGLTNSATTRSLSRQNIAQIQQAAENGLELPVASKEDWLVTMKVGQELGITPGLPNSSNRYIP
ncbi:MAG: hypothetical protein J6R96_04805 [Spirochaetaceae bacterium]|nr:hypothetical protein [Spirochaetaceae bacterium]